MWQVTLYMSNEDYGEEYFFHKKENAEKFFREALKEEISYWVDYSPKEEGYDNWDEYINDCVKRGWEPDIGHIKEVTLED